MIKEVKNVKCDYKGAIELSDDYKEKIMNYWEQLQSESDLLKEGRILVVSNMINNNDDFIERGRKLILERTSDKKK